MTTPKGQLVVRLDCGHRKAWAYDLLFSGGLRIENGTYCYRCGQVFGIQDIIRGKRYFQLERGVKP